MRKEDLTPQLFDKFCKTRTLHGLINRDQDPRALPLDVFEIPVDEIVEFFKNEAKNRAKEAKKLYAKLNRLTLTPP